MRPCLSLQMMVIPVVSLAFWADNRDARPIARASTEQNEDDRIPSWIYSRSTFRTKTDANGRYRIGGLPDAEFAMHAEPVQRKWVVRPRILRLGVAQHRRDVVMELGHAVEVTGVVVESGKGSPIERASVIALTDGDPAIRMGNCTTDSQGRFTLRLPAGRAKLYFGSVPSGFVYPDPQIVAEIEVTTQQQSRAPWRLALRRDG